MNDIEWRGNTPFSRHFNDHYYQPDHGYAESEYTFVQGNNLPTRFSDLSHNHQFIVGELGFGTGLNFITTARTWLRTAPASARLVFISTEKYPLTPAALRQALNASVTEHDELLHAFINAYALAGHIKHTYWSFTFGLIELRVYFGDASTTLARHRFTADAWFLDGFAPRSNPQLWSQQLMCAVAKHSKIGTSIATFSSARVVRENLSHAGFRVKKRTGYGSKREAVTAQLVDSSPAKLAPWLTPPSPNDVKHVAIIGAGLAGCSTARALAERGISVSLFESHARVANETSGQHRLVLFPRLTRDWSRLGSYAWIGAHATLNAVKRIAPHAIDSHPLLAVGYTEQERARLRAIAGIDAPCEYDANRLTWLDRAQASHLACVPLEFGALKIEAMSSVNPRALCTALIDHANITTFHHTHVEAISAGTNTRWALNATNVQVAVDAVVFATHRAELPLVNDQALTVELPTRLIRGQVSRIISTPASASLNTILCHKGYLTPAIDGAHSVGATFNPNDTRTDYDPAHDKINLTTLSTNLPSTAAALELNAKNALSADVAFRSTTADHLPLVGPLADAALMRKRFAALTLDAKNTPDEPVPWFEGLYANLAHGSRGLVGCTLCAEHIAALICATPTPLPHSLYGFLDPQRYIIRDLIRSE